MGDVLEVVVEELAALQEVVGATDALESIKTGVVGTRSDKGREE